MRITRENCAKLLKGKSITYEMDDKTKYQTFVADISFEKGITLINEENESMEVYCVNKSNEMLKYNVEEEVYDKFLFELFNYFNENDSLTFKHDLKIANNHFVFRPNINANQAPCAFK